jgi:hypothetical protein
LPHSQHSSLPFCEILLCILISLPHSVFHSLIYGLQTRDGPVKVFPSSMLRNSLSFLTIHHYGAMSLFANFGLTSQVPQKPLQGRVYKYIRLTMRQSSKSERPSFPFCENRLPFPIIIEFKVDNRASVMVYYSAAEVSCMQL